MNRILIAALIAAAAGTPAFAREGVCTTTSQIRDAAAQAQPEAQAKALRAVATAEKLCEAGNDRAAKDKLEIAMRALNLQQASLAAPTTGQ